MLLFEFIENREYFIQGFKTNTIDLCSFKMRIQLNIN